MPPKAMAPARSGGPVRGGPFNSMIWDRLKYINREQLCQERGLTKRFSPIIYDLFTSSSCFFAQGWIYYVGGKS